MLYGNCNVSDRDPAHYRDAAHRAQPTQKLILEIVDLKLKIEHLDT